MLRPRSGRLRQPSAASFAQSPALCIGLAALMGLILALVVYPPSFLAGDAARYHGFLFPNDPLIHRVAWQALVQRGQPWPSLWTDMFNYPVGVPITLMDGLPLAATVFRPFMPWLPGDFHYFGLWHAVAVVLQAVAGAVFARAAGVRHLVPCLCAALFALAMPIFVGRINWTHVALATQGLLLLALALCVHASRARPSLVFLFPRAAGLSLVALAVHPPLALSVLLFCLLATALSRAPIPRRAAGAAVLCVLFVALCQGLGIFAAGSLANHAALGDFGFSPWGMIAGEPDSLREVYGARGPGIEQDAWLGWGCVFLLAVGLAFPPRLRIPRGYTALAWTIAALAVVAISPWVRVGARVLDFSIFLPDAVIDLYAIYRATVRLAWPLVMALTLLPLAHFVLAWPRRRALAVLGIALALQIHSAWPYWAYEYRDARLQVTRRAPTPAILEGGSRLRLVDGIRGASIEASHWHHAMHLAAASGIPLERGLFARSPPSGPGPGGAHLRLGHDAGARYLAPAPDSGGLPSALPQVPRPVACEPWEVLLVCRAE